MIQHAPIPFEPDSHVVGSSHWLRGSAFDESVTHSVPRKREGPDPPMEIRPFLPHERDARVGATGTAGSCCTPDHRWSGLLHNQETGPAAVRHH